MSTIQERMKKYAELDAKRTRGEWLARDRWVGVLNHVSYIAECRDQNGNWTIEPMPLANAAFIASAPSMFSDLQATVRALEVAREALERCGRIGNILYRAYSGNAGKYGKELQELANQTLGKAGV